ncbi:MAG: calcium/sodium antiporter [Candidatus Pacebacteria bacterium]|nr:calcium/sodium antiporter [Candidatus Paceibacterota bacterium]
MLTYFLFALGFVVLIKGADILVDGAAAIAKKFHISNLVIGLTIVAFGTSAPELAVNLFSSFQGNSDLALGNILGSNIVNMLLILGIAAIVYPLKVKTNTVWKEIPFSLLGAVLLLFIANDVFFDGALSSAITRTDGLALIGFFIIFLYYTFGSAKNTESLASDTIESRSTPVAIGMVVVGLIGLIFGGQWIVSGAVKIAELFGMSQSLIGLTVVAIGTSLPELATTVTASLKKQSDMAIGGVVGSNIFNIFWILGLSSIIRPLPVHAASNLDLSLGVVASLLLFVFLFIGKRHVLERWQGWLFVILYVCYIGFSVIT